MADILPKRRVRTATMQSLEMGGTLRARTLVRWNMEQLSTLHTQHMDVVEHRPGPASGGEPATPLTQGQTHRVDVRPTTQHDLSAVLALLEENQLPTVGVREHFQHFLVAYDGTTLVGSAGLEIYGHAGLLRSLAVAAPYRSHGLGRQLTEGILALARHKGLASVALLTVTAQHYFPRYGFEPVERSRLPGALTYRKNKRYFATATVRIADNAE